jgi:hypothetical protein
MMKTVEIGRPIELDEEKGRLLQLISNGDWNQIDPQVLKSLIPDTSLFVNFLKEHDLADTTEAKVVLERLGVEVAEPERAMAASAARRSRGHEILAKRRAILSKKAAAKKSGQHESFAKRRGTRRMKKAAVKAAKAAAKKNRKAKGHNLAKHPNK